MELTPMNLIETDCSGCGKVIQVTTTPTKPMVCYDCYKKMQYPRIDISRNNRFEIRRKLFPNTGGEI